MLSVASALVCLTASAQSQVTGKVIDSEGLEVIGAGVFVKGVTGSGTVTDADGHYSITVADPKKPNSYFHTSV